MLYYFEHIQINVKRTSLFVVKYFLLNILTQVLRFSSVE